MLANEILTYYFRYCSLSVTLLSFFNCATDININLCLSIQKFWFSRDYFYKCMPSTHSGKLVCRTVSLVAEDKKFPCQRYWECKVKITCVSAKDVKLE